MKIQFATNALGSSLLFLVK